jgi:hypothetical protein
VNRVKGLPFASGIADKIGEIGMPAADSGASLSILATSFNYRSFANWEPALRRLHDDGHRIHTAFFPRVSDPDHAGLLDVGFDNIGMWEIDDAFQPVNFSQETVLTRVGRWIASESPDLIWMCTVHGGPEQHIRGKLLQMELTIRPLVVGLQHGMAHDWPRFEGWADRFDVFGTFGRFFLDECSPGFRQRMVVTGLPKLDSIAGRPRYGRRISRILFAAQEEPSVEDAGRLLGALAADLDAEIVVRPHPELREAFRPLASRFRLDSPDVPLERSLATVDAMITTGSTAALEGLAAGLPVAVLPRQRGDIYGRAGIVADGLTGPDVVAVWRRYRDPCFVNRILAFLEETTGAASGGRAAITVAAIDRLARSRARARQLA